MIYRVRDKQTKLFLAGYGVFGNHFVPEVSEAGKVFLKIEEAFDFVYALEKFFEQASVPFRPEDYEIVQFGELEIIPIIPDSECWEL